MGFTGRPDTGQDLPQLLLCPGPDMRKTTILLLVVTAIAIDLAAGKFCPKERNRDKCKAKTNQYKCGVFYKDMVKRKRLSYIGALPDDLTEKNRPQWKTGADPGRQSLRPALQISLENKTKEKCLGERNTEPGADVSIFLLRRHLGHGQQQRESSDS